MSKEQNIEGFKNVFKQLATYDTVPHSVDETVLVDAKVHARSQAAKFYRAMVLTFKVNPEEIEADEELIFLGLATRNTDNSITYVNASSIPDRTIKL